MIEVREGRYYVNGPLTLNNIVQIRALGLQQFSAGVRGQTSVEVDFAGVTAVDSSALSMVFEWKRELAKRGCALRIQNATPSMRSLAVVYEVHDLFPQA